MYVRWEVPVGLVWDDRTPDILIESFIGDWTIDGYRASRNQARQAMDRASGRVDLIVVVEGIHMSLSDIRHFSEVSRTTLINDPHVGLTVIVGMKPQDQPIFDLFTRIYSALSAKLVMADSLDHARELIKAHRQI